MGTYQIISEQGRKKYQTNAQAKQQQAAFYTVGPDGFVYRGRIKTQEFDKRYYRR